MALFLQTDRGQARNLSNGGGRFIAGGFDAEDDHGRRRKGSGNLEGVHGTDDAHRPFVEHVRVDHGRFDVGMSEQRLHGADVLARLLYHLSVEEDHGIERLVLSGCGHLIFYG